MLPQQNKPQTFFWYISLGIFYSRGLIQHDITYNIVITILKYTSQLFLRIEDNIDRAITALWDIYFVS